MSFYNSFRNPFVQVKNILEQNVSSLEKVVLEKFKVADLPMAIIQPQPTPIEKITNENFLILRLRFKVWVFIRETEPENVFEELVQPMAQIIDVILDNPTLNGTVKEVYPVNFAVGEIEAMNRLYYGGTILFEALAVHSY